MTQKTAKTSGLKSDDLIVITGAGGFIGRGIGQIFQGSGFSPDIRAVDRKPLPEWYQITPGVESLCLDVSESHNCEKVCEGAVEVYNLAADMGGMGFIERFRIQCLRSILVNTHMIEAAWRAGAQRYFFASSACAYNTTLQKDPHCKALKESDAYPAMAERGYGWEKLMFQRNVLPGIHRRARPQDRHRPVPQCIWAPGHLGRWPRKSVPAAICRKVIAAKDTGKHEINIWGDGEQTRSFMYIDDCTHGHRL
jgi:GDP-D-mannose 3',5'-epimerase